MTGGVTPSPRRVAFVTGVLFILTFISAIVGLILYGPVLDDPNYVIGPGSDGRIVLGAICEIVLCIANIGTALTLFSILKRQNEGLALGYVAARIVESTIIAVGIISLLSVVTLRREFAAAGATDPASFLTAANALVAVHDWTFLLGPGFVVGVGNGLMLGYLMYKSGLVPRGMAMLGLVGGPLVCLSGIAVMFGLYPQVSVWSFILTVPEILWEASLGIYLTVRGFRPSPILGESGLPSPAGKR